MCVFPGWGGGCVSPLRNMMEPFRCGAACSSPPPKGWRRRRAAVIYESSASPPLVESSSVASRRVSRERRRSRAGHQGLHSAESTHSSSWTRTGLLVPTPSASHTLTSGSRRSRTAGRTGTLSCVSLVAWTCNMSCSVCNWVTPGPLRPSEAAFNQGTGSNQRPAGSFPQMCVGYVMQMCFSFCAFFFFFFLLHRLTHFRDGDAITIALGVFCSSQSDAAARLLLNTSGY